VGEGEVIWTVPGHAIGRWRNVFVQVRSGEMTLDTLKAIETAAHLARTGQRPFPRRGALLVLADGAPPTLGDTRRVQEEQVKRFVDDERLFVATVLEGDGLYATVQRASVHALMGTSRRRIFNTVGEGAEWLLREIGDGEDAPRLVDYVMSLRAG
jgi:hypothetical protein